MEKKICILVAIEPRCYAYAIAAAISELRPLAGVGVVEPGELDEQVERLGPRLVLCSRSNPFTSKGRPRWVEYYPYADEPEFEIRIDGQVAQTRNVELEDLLAIIDEALCPGRVRG